MPATSGQALSAGRLTTITDSGAFYFDPTDAAQYGKAVGITGSAVGIGDAVEVHCNGVVPLVGAGFTPGQRFWAGPNGTLLTSPPSSGLVVPVGYAIDADNLFVQIESYLEW